MRTCRASFTLKILLIAFVALLIPLYWANYGITNFLWVSDISLFLTVIAIVTESPLIMSILVVGILPFEIAWNIDYFAQLISGYNVLTISHYMFAPHYNLFMRSLSLFHIILPVLWIWYLKKWGYMQRAVRYAIPLLWAIFLTTYLVTKPVENINWVFLADRNHWYRISSLTWLTILIIGVPLCITFPWHEILKHITRKARKKKAFLA
jgi:hypothetical protein